jgi:predicted RNA-binding protein YlxR (DUF448 family)
LKKIAEGEHYILGKLDYLEKLNAKIERHDAARLRELEQQYSLASGKEKILLKKEIEIEYQKVQTEEGIKNPKEKILRLTKGFNNSVNAAVKCLQSGGYLQGAKKYLEEAIRHELAIKELFSDISGLEKTLRKLIGNEEKLITHPRF